jgi:hypothetical protein
MKAFIALLLVVALSACYYKPINIHSQHKLYYIPSTDDYYNLCSFIIARYQIKEYELDTKLFPPRANSLRQEVCLEIINEINPKKEFNSDV